MKSTSLFPHYIRNHRLERQRQLEEIIAASGTDIARALIREISEKPLRVKHEVSRKNPPRPSRMCFVFYNATGERWQTTPYDLTFKHAARVQLPNLAWMTGRKEDLAIPPMFAEVLLEYDPRD